MKSGNTKRISASKHWVFTWNNYEQSDIDSLLNLSGVNKYIFQEEIGENKTKHLQGYVCFDKRVRPKGLLSEKIHWERCRNIKNSIKYCSKEDTRNGKRWIKNIKIEKEIKVISEDKMYKWQKEIINIVDNEVNDRIIYWYWENIGNVGKTALCKWLCVKKDALVLNGCAKDMMNAIVNWYNDKGYWPELIVCDIPRSRMDYISYGGLEKIKDGLFYSGKYEGKMCVMNSPHMICFGNSKPKEFEMSLDRWHIVEICKDNENKKIV